TAHAACAAYAGLEFDARRDAHEALAAGERCGSRSLQEWAYGTLAFLEVSVGNHEAALAAVQPLIASLCVAVDATEVVTSVFVPDAVEAMIAIARFSDAEPLIDALESNGSRLDRAWMLAMGARCRALLIAAS